MRTAAILPVKRFEMAKQRLGMSIADSLRLELAAAMVADVIVALQRAEAIELTIVVTNERAVAPAARQAGAIIVADAHEQGQSAAVQCGVRRALEEGFQRVLCIPGDCPALSPEELNALLRPSPSPTEVVIVPDRHGTGTNGLLLAPPDVICASFGPDSCERHQNLARAAGVACRLEHPSSLLLDIDTGSDLQELRARLAGERANAARTRAVLGLTREVARSSAA